MKKLLLIITVFIGLLFLPSCDMDDDGYSLGKYWLTSGSVIKTADYYYIVTDGGSNLWPSASNVNPEDLEDGMRVLVNYTILGDADDSELYDYYVRVNETSKILTKPIFNFTDETAQTVKDSIGHDAVTINDTWFTDNYLNVEFEYGGGSTVHYVNLVYDSEFPETNEGDIILELKHNKNGDSNNYLLWGIASFDISELQITGESSVNIFVRSLDKAGEYQYNKVLTYEYGSEVEMQNVNKMFDKNKEGAQKFIE